MLATPNNLDLNQKIYALQHLDSHQYICLLQDGTDYLACFSDGDTALEFRTALGLQEHVDVAVTCFDQSPFTHFWLDGKNVVLPEKATISRAA